MGMWFKQNAEIFGELFLLIAAGIVSWFITRALEANLPPASMTFAFILIFAIFLVVGIRLRNYGKTERRHYK